MKAIYTRMIKDGVFHPTHPGWITLCFSNEEHYVNRCAKRAEEKILSELDRPEGEFSGWKVTSSVLHLDTDKPVVLA